MKRRKAFTLIELLVVVTIISFLMTIFLPSLNTARQQTSGMVCLNHQKNLTAAWLMYCGDNQNFLVGGDIHETRTSVYAPHYSYSWVDWPQEESGHYDPSCLDNELRGIEKGLLFDYLQITDVYHCPSDKRLDNPSIEVFRSYTLAGGLNGEQITVNNISVPVTKYDKISLPSEKYVFVEAGHCGGWNRGSWVIRDPWDLNGSRWTDPVSVRHQQSSTLSFADGHAEKHEWIEDSTMKLSQIYQYDFDCGYSIDLVFMKRGYAYHINTP